MDIVDKVRRLEARRDRVALDAEREQAALDRVTEEVSSFEEAQVVLQAVAEELQNRAHRRISKVVTRCLAAVFEEPYEFEIRFEQKRGKTEARLILRRNGEEYAEPVNEVGGGVLDVAALALRLSVVAASRPIRRRLFVLDEPWSNVRGRENRERTGRLLKVLSDEFGVQWIVNTDIPDYRAGKIVEDLE